MTYTSPISPVALGIHVLDNDGYYTATNVEEVLKEIQERRFQVLEAPTGFENRIDSDFYTVQPSYAAGPDELTVTVTHVNDFSIFVRGLEIIKTATDTVVISAPAEGVYWIYYDSAGTLAASATPFDFGDTTKAPVAVLHWDDSNSQVIYLGDERHGAVFDSATHALMHDTVGTRYESGLTISGYALSTDTNAAVSVGVAAGIIHDEDVAISIVDDATPDTYWEQDLSDPAKIPIFYRDGAAGNWRKIAATDYPFHPTGSGRLAYDNVGVGLAEGTNNYYIAYWIFATNDINNPIISIMGQRQDLKLVDAKANNTYESLAFGTLPFQEMKALYRIILQTKTVLTNAIKSTIEDVADHRALSTVATGTYVASSHSLLSDLSNDDHTQYLLADGTRALTGDWAVGAHAISGITTLDMTGQLTNTLAIGTPPFVITSTDVVANLNVDMVDGYNLDQAVLQASSPTFVGLTLSGAIATPTTITTSGIVTVGSDIISKSVNSLRRDTTGSRLGLYSTNVWNNGMAMALYDDATGMIVWYDGVAQWTVSSTGVGTLVGALQIGGNLTGVADLTLSGAIATPTTISASGVISTTATSMAIDTDGLVGDVSYLQVGIRAQFGYDGVAAAAYMAGLAGKGVVIRTDVNVDALSFTSAGVGTFVGDVTVGGDLSADFFALDDQYFSLSEGINGEPLLRIPYVNNVLFAAEKRFTIVKTGNVIAYNPVYLFDGNLSNYTGLQILDGEVVTLHFDIDDKGEMTSLAYPYGYLYIHMYYTYLAGSVRARLKTTNGGVLTWRTWRDGVDISKQGGRQLWRIQFSGNYICEEMEIEFTASGTDAWVSEIEWNLDRNLDHRTFPTVQKMVENNLYSTFRLKDSSNVTTITMTTAGAITLAGDLTAANIVTAGLVDGVDVAALKTDVDGFNDELKDLTQVEIQQLELIDATTISGAQWGYLGALDQGLTQASSPTFVGLTLTGAIATPTNISMTGELDMTGALACIDLNPAGTGSKSIIDITPAANLVAGSSWRGIRQLLSSLDPATGAACDVRAIDIDMSGFASVDGDAQTIGMIVFPPPADSSYAWYHYMKELTATKVQTGLFSFGSGVYSVTGTYRGVHLDWDAITRDAGAPVLEGIRVDLPADYTGFGTSFAGYFSGGGENVMFCQGNWSILTGPSTQQFGIAMYGELQIGGAYGHIDLNPAGTGSKNIIDITPTASLALGSTWVGIQQNIEALDPAAGGASSVMGMRITASALRSAANDANVYGYLFYSPDQDNSFGFYHSMNELDIAGRIQTGYITYGAGPYSITSTYRGLYVSWSTITRDANAPVLEGIRVDLPADYTGFGANFAGYFSGDGRSVTICDTNYALNVVGTMSLAGAIAGVGNLWMVGELDMTGVLACIDLNPAATGTQNVIDITPSAALDAGSSWYGVYQDLTALDPATGAPCTIIGYYIDSQEVNSVDGDAITLGYYFIPSRFEDSIGFASALSELTADKEQDGFRSIGSLAILSKTATYRGLYVVWDGITRDDEAPVLQGINVQLPADYTNFGANFGAYFSGDGRTVTICDTTYALATSGAMNLVGSIAGVTTFSAGTATFEVAADGYITTYPGMVIGADNYVLTYDHALGTLVLEAAATGTDYDADLNIGSGNTDWINCPFEGASGVASDLMTFEGAVLPQAATYLTYSVPLPISRGGKFLHITGTRVGLDDADGANYVTSTVIRSYLTVNAGPVAMDTDPTDKNSVGVHEDATPSVTLSASYQVVKVILQTIVGTPNALDVVFVSVRYYYA